MEQVYGCSSADFLAKVEECYPKKYFYSSGFGFVRCSILSNVKINLLEAGDETVVDMKVRLSFIGFIVLCLIAVFGWVFIHPLVGPLCAIIYGIGLIMLGQPCINHVLNSTSETIDLKPLKHRVSK